MQNYFTFTSVSILFCCFLVGALYAFLLYRKNNNLSPAIKYALAAGRTITVGLTCWLLFSPLLKTISYTLEKPVIVLAHDNSRSVKEIRAAGFDSAAYRADMLRLEQQLAERYEVRTFSFSDSVKTGLDFSDNGKSSNAAAFVSRITDELQNRNIGAIIIASDGIFNRGGNPAYALNKLKAPVYTIALGDTVPKRDVLIANVNYNDLVYLDNDFTIEVQVQAYQSKGESTRLTVSENGKALFQEVLPIQSGVYVKEVPVRLHAGLQGVRKYTVEVSGVANEITTQNNKQDFFIEAVDGKQEVLIAANAPHPDIAAIRQAIESNKNYKVTLAMAGELASLDLNKFGTVILYQLPAIQNPADNFFQKLKSSNASLWFILGAQSNLSAFNSVQKAVKMNGTPGNMQEVFPVPDKNFMSFSVSEGFDKQLQTLDPLLAPFGSQEVPGNTSALLNQRIGAVTTGNPLLFFINADGRKVCYLLGEGLWRWKLNDSQNGREFSVVDNLVAKVVQYLSVKDDKRKFRAFPARNTYEENENVLFNAHLYNDNYALVNTPEVRLKIKNAAGKTFNYTFSKTETAYSLDAGPFPKGSYSFEAEVTFAGKMLRSSGIFYVKEILAEYQQTTANHQLLNVMAVQNNGRMYLPADLLNIAGDLEKSGQVKTLSYEDRRFEALINIKWLFVLIMVLLSAEWFVRKRNGEL